MVGARNDSNTVNHGLPVHSVEIDDLALRFLSGDRFTIARRSDVPLLRGESPFFWTFPGIRALCVPNYWKKYIFSHQPRVHEDTIMKTGFLRVLLSPGNFFEERMRTEPGLKVPALIALVIGVIGAVSAALATNLTIGILPADMQGLGGIMVAGVAVAAVIGGFLTWIVVGIVFYLISMIFKGKGSLTRTLEFTGYGFLPQVFGSLIGVVLSYQILSGITVPAATSPEEIVAVTETLTEMLAADPLTSVATLVTVLFLLWSANIWIFGMKYARGLSTRNAALTVGIPVGLYIISLLIPLIGWL
ncbi:MULTISPECIES: YIP1 family protein [unclassified Methanoculleus]|uniref:YIP1 family protein n=1 Tax=unclassified Methanoculleus TaxID=2619537 RepID=UPI0025FFCE7E|nr:Yip1 family protein [Methanoculleus sp. UBA377]